MTALDEALLAFNRSTREMGLGGPVKIVQTDTDPGDMGEPRIVHDEYGNTIVFVPSYELWPKGAAVSDAAVDVFAEAFEEDQIRLAVAAAMAKLAKDVRGLPTEIVSAGFGYGQYQGAGFVYIARAAVLALIEKATR